MKKSLIISSVMLLLSITAVHAQSASPTSTARPNASDRKALNEEFKQQRDSARATMKAEIDKMKSATASAKAEMKNQRDVMKSARASARIEAKENRCELGKNRVEITLNTAAKAQSLHAEQYKNAAARLQSLITELKSRGANTTSLESALTTMNTLIKKVDDEYKLYVQKLNELKNISCTPAGSSSPAATTSASESAFRNALEASRMQRMNVRKAVMAVREHYVNVVRKEVVATRQSLATGSPRANRTASPAPSRTPLVTSPATSTQ